MARQRALKDGSKPYVYLLRGIIRCGLCGNVMTPKPGKDAKRYPYYVCTRVANYGGDGCDAPHLPAQAIEEHFLGILSSLSTDEERLKVLVSRSSELQNKTMQELDRDSQRIQREKSKLQERIAPFVEAIEQGGASASRSVMDRLAKLEAELEDLERGAGKVEERREELRTKMSDYDTVVRAYRGLADALNSEEERESLSDLIATIVEQITWTPATDPTGKHKYSGGSYDYVLFDNPLLSHEFRKARSLEEDESSSYGQVWLPADHDHRTNPFAVFEDCESLFLHYRSRQPVLLLTPKEEKTRVLGSRRRWVRNPILIAREMERDLKRSKKANQSTVAKMHGVTRTRVSQYLKLLSLPGSIVAFMENPANDEAAAKVTESALRELLKLRDEGEIQRAFQALLLNPEQRP